ncbi:alpha/beta-hydrolase [Dentipellis sp. KUC8613]|nr:alpha/beta-hydrolase [Dentipellis sp. KUC8613]
MRWLRAIAIFGSIVACASRQFPLPLPVGGIPDSAYDELVRFAKFSSAVYQLICPRPLGSTLVESFTSLITDAHGFVARDDETKEIVVAFRGSKDLEDLLTADGNVILIPYESPGVQLNSTEPVEVHAGFLISFNSIARTAIGVVQDQLESYPNYTVVVTGHSLGGAIASLASVSFRVHFPSAHIRLFTFGQPRTGNPGYADVVGKLLGHNNVYRAVHTWDGVPTILPESWGYRHHATEYWQYMEPPEPSTVRRCSGQEDPSCSDSIASTGINLAHGLYFGQIMTADATLCL